MAKNRKRDRKRSTPVDGGSGASSRREPEAELMRDGSQRSKLPRVLSTSLGVALAANMVLAPAAFGSGSAADNAQNGSSTGSDQPKLVGWSTDAVKRYFDPAVDWNLPLPDQSTGNGQSGNGGGTGTGTGNGGGQTVIVHNGLSWSDLLLYHLIFNSGRSYSSTQWYDTRPVYRAGTHTVLKPRTFSSGTFQNKPTAGSAVRPKTVNRSGSITRRGSTGRSSVGRSTSSPRGGIGGRSGGFGGGFGG